jgi:hypothetical protein
MNITAELRRMRNHALSGMVAPALQFFTPTPAFFKALKPYKSTSMVEAGAGLGKVTQEAQAKGFKMMAIDIMPREGQWENVLTVDAESMPYSSDLWLLMCRPDHSGWAYDTLEIALKRGAGVFYAGLERNFEIDLGDYVGREAKRWDGIGEDGESLFLFMPESLLPPEDEDD